LSSVDVGTWISGQPACVSTLALAIRGRGSDVPTLALASHGLIFDVPTLALASHGLIFDVSTLALAIHGLIFDVSTLTLASHGLIFDVSTLALDKSALSDDFRRWQSPIEHDCMRIGRQGPHSESAFQVLGLQDKKIPPKHRECLGGMATGRSPALCRHRRIGRRRRDRRG